MRIILSLAFLSLVFLASCTRPTIDGYDSPQSRERPNVMKNTGAPHGGPAMTLPNRVGP